MRLDTTLLATSFREHFRYKSTLYQRPSRNRISDLYSNVNLVTVSNHKYEKYKSIGLTKLKLDYLSPVEHKEHVITPVPCDNIDELI